MTEQLSFLDSPTHRRSRKSDPPTSQEAAQRNAEGLGLQTLAVFALISRYPGHTACELAKRWGVTEAGYLKRRYAVSRRAAELRRDGLVRAGTPRICTVAGSKQMTWYPT
jgi:hypothetical protein